MPETPTTETPPRPTWTADELAAVLRTADEVGVLLGVSADTVKNLHRMGQLVGVKVGRSLRWRPADVRAFVEALEPAKEPLTPAAAVG